MTVENYENIIFFRTPYLLNLLHPALKHNEQEVGEQLLHSFAPDQIEKIYDSTTQYEK